MSNEHKFTNDDLRNENSKYAKSTMSDDEFNQANEKADNLGEQMENFRLLLDIIQDALNGKFKVDGGTLAMIIGAVMYVIFPMDVIPDIIPILGWTDDIGMIALIMVNCANVIEQYKQWISQNSDTNSNTNNDEIIIDSEKE